MKLTLTQMPYVDTADLFTEVADQPWAMLLDSGAISNGASIHHSQRYDVLAIKPHSTLVFDGKVTHFYSGALQDALHGDPLEILKSAIPTVENETEIDCPYLPGAIGYFSYDLSRQFETFPDLANDDENLPPLSMGIYYVVVVIDHISKVTSIVHLGQSHETKQVVAEWQRLIQRRVDEEKRIATGVKSDPEAQHTVSHPSECGGLVSNTLQESMDWNTYRRAFEKVRQYTVEGDCYQVNLTKRFTAISSGNAWLTYRYLRENSPAPYGAYFNLPFAQVLSNSPESFIQCRGHKVVTRPIKGTRPRDLYDQKLDAAAAEALQLSQKDRAENLMIVDLMRNDLGRCCELGSVKVPRLFELHSFANVHHLISTVTGTLREELHVLDLLRSCFPGGSITGAPKIRAMEIIEELEPHRRGLYCGSIGYVGSDGSLETNIAIRTIVVKDGVARFAAGGGLVIDSEVAAEHQELLDKARMMAEALFVNGDVG